MSSTVVKFDFDQYPENTATSTNEGLIIKFSADESHFSGTNYEGLSAKLLIFCPRFYGVCASCIFLYHVKVTREIQNWAGFDISLNNNFDVSPIQKEIFFDDFYDQTSSSSGKIRSFRTPSLIRLFKSVDGSLVKCGMTFLFYNKDGVIDNRFYMSRLEQNATTVYPCYYYNYYIPSPNFSIYYTYNGFQPLFDLSTPITDNNPSIYEACVAQPSSLSDRMKQIFPNSWLQ